MDALKKRLDELEIRLSYQQKTIDELNEVVIEFADRVRRLERENGRLRETLSLLAPEPGVSPDE